MVGVAVVVVVEVAVMVRGVGRSSGDGADGVEVVSDKAFFGDENEEGEFFEDGDLGDFVDVDGSEPTARVFAVGHVNANIGADGDHGIPVRLMEVGGAVDAGSADGSWSRLACKAGLDFIDGAVEWCTGNIDAFRDARHGIVGKCRIRHYSQSKRLCVLPEEGGSVAGFGLDYFVTPFQANLGS